MQFKIRYKREFWYDIEIVIEWYNLIIPKPSSQFYNSFKESEQKIILNPFAYRHLEKSKFRRCILRKFPYKIVYEIDGDTIVILALIHTSRSNKFIKTKLK